MSTEAALDVIWEAEGIAQAIGRTPRQVNHMLATGALAGAKKVGGRWCITRDALRTLFGATSKEAA